MFYQRCGDSEVAHAAHFIRDVKAIDMLVILDK